MLGQKSAELLSTVFGFGILLGKAGDLVGVCCINMYQYLSNKLYKSGMGIICMPKIIDPFL